MNGRQIEGQSGVGRFFRRHGWAHPLVAFGLLVAWGYGCAPTDGDAGNDAAAAATAAAQTLKFFPPAGPDGPARPFSEAVQVGNTLYLAGKLGMLPDGSGLAPGGIQPETRQAMENIQAVVEAHGGSMDRIAKCTVFLADIAEWAAMNEVYTTYFPEGRRPARSAVGVGGMAREARVEIECIAVLK